MAPPNPTPQPAGGKYKTPAKPPVRLKYLLWDGTDPEDSKALGDGLEGRFRWQNLLVDSPKNEEFVVKGPPRIFQPDYEGSVPSDYNDRFKRGGVKFEFPRAFFDPTHHNAGGVRPNLLAFSGHGMPGFMFGGNNILICSSRPVTPDAENARNLWEFERRPVRPSRLPYKWDDPSIKIVLMSACRQLQGKPQQFYWSQAMRGSNPVHMILGYHDTAPGASTSARINRQFLGYLYGTDGTNGQSILNAWRNAHVRVKWPGWAALCYESCVGDRLDYWTSNGTLASTPDPAGTIRYFDSGNLDNENVDSKHLDDGKFDSDKSGIEVKEPKQHLDCFLTDRGDPVPYPPWRTFNENHPLDLHVQFIRPEESFHNGDEVWVSVVQVRPDFEAYFDIKELILFDVDHPADNPLTTGHVQPGLLVHTNYGGFVADTYRFTVDRGASFSWVRYDSNFNELTIPIKMGKLGNDRHPNDRHPQCYFMIRVSDRDSRKWWQVPREFGIPTVGTGDAIQADQDRLIDDFQFSVFLPPQTVSRGSR